MRDSGRNWSKEVDDLRARKNEKSKIISQMRIKGESVDELFGSKFN